jgi:hypothetical protein
VAKRLYGGRQVFGLSPQSGAAPPWRLVGPEPPASWRAAPNKGIAAVIHHRAATMPVSLSPRIIHIPLSGGDRKAQAKGIRYAHGIHASHFRQSVLIRSAAEARLREADRLECEAWNAIMWAGGHAMSSASACAAAWASSRTLPRSLSQLSGQPRSHLPSI